MKKLIALVLALALVLACCSVAFAANDGSVTVNNAVPNEVYKLYKVFDLTYETAETSSGAEGGDTLKSGVAYTYTKTGNSDELYTALTTDADSPFTLTATTTTNVYQVTLKQNKGATDISSYLKTIESKLNHITPDKTAPAAASGSSTSFVSWDSLAYGYYYVTSSVGATVTIDSTLKNVSVQDKNSVPGQDKKQQVGTSAPTTAAGYTDSEVQIQVGDHVWYQIEVTDGKGTNAHLYITDTMSAGLSFDNNITVYKSIKSASGYGSEEQVTTGENTWTTVTKGEEDTWTFKLDFVPTFVSSLNDQDKVYIRFSATVTEDAVATTAADRQNNTSRLDYSHTNSQDTVYAQTYKFQLDKTKNAANNYADLLGAKFELYRGSSVSGGTKIWFKKGTAEGTGESAIPVLDVVAAGTDGAFSTIELTEGTTGNSLGKSKVIIKGLDLDTYVLRETQAPVGYNKAPDQTVATSYLVALNGTITDVSAAITGDEHVMTVVNETGTELPSTGGIGTTIFYILGGLLVIGAAVILVARRKAQD